MRVDLLEPGYYKLRSRARGPWIPIYVYWADGERDPETWELLSDQTLAAEWAPRTDSPRLWPINPDRLVNRAIPTTKDEFQWLMLLRQISHQASQRQLPM